MGLEAAIVLIAFVIIAAVFSFMVVNQGLFATERGKAVIQEGLKQASTPLSIDGSILVRITPDGQKASVIVIPLRAFGVEYVAMWKNETVVTLKVGPNAWANAYLGVLYEGYPYPNSSQLRNYNASSITYNPFGKKIDDFAGFQIANTTMQGTHCYTPVNETYSNALQKNALITGASLVISNSNGDESLDAYEKGYLIITLASSDQPRSRDQITVEVRLEKTAPLSLVFNIPESMPKDTYVRV